MKFVKIFADINDFDKIYEKYTSDKEALKKLFNLLIKRTSDDVSFFNDENNRKKFINKLIHDKKVRSLLKDTFNEELSILYENSDISDINEKITSRVNSEEVSDYLSVAGKIYLILYGKDAFLKLVANSIRNFNKDSNLKEIEKSISLISTVKDISGLKTAITNLRELVDKKGNDELKTFIRKSYFIRISQSVNIDNIKKLLLSNLVKATINILNKEKDEKNKEKLFSDIQKEVSDLYLNDIKQMTLYMDAVNKILEKQKKQYSGETEIFKNNKIKNKSVSLLKWFFGIWQIRNYGLWILHATEEFCRQYMNNDSADYLLKKLNPFNKKQWEQWKNQNREYLLRFLNQQWKEKYKNELKQMISKEVIKEINEDYAVDNQFASDWETLKEDDNKTELNKILMEYIDESINTLGKQKINDYYYGKKNKKIDGLEIDDFEKIKNEVCNDLVTQVLEEI